MKTKHPSHVLKALGIDPLTGSYHYDGTELHVDGHTEIELQAEHDKLDIPAIEKAEQDDHVRRQRRDEYPDIGDQLDAIWSIFSANGLVLPAGAKKLKKDIDDVKKRHPK